MDVFFCKSSRDYKKNVSGFTLIEILVAVMIFGIIMLTVFSAFRSFAVSSDMIRNNMAASQISAGIARVMTRDFLSLRIALEPEYSRPVSGGKTDDKDRFRFVGDETVGKSDTFSRVRFASLAHISFGSNKRAGAARIIYYLRPDNQGRFDLCRSDTLNRFDETDGNECDPVICKDVTMFKVAYIDTEGEEHSYWDSESDEYGYATPVSVLINMEFMAGSSIHKFSTTFAMPLFRPPAKI
ncbi:MAG: type II secretion system protein [Desulfamplus sp.]|nr:type II secretion system protein [Desulfamplus sp.]